MDPVVRRPARESGCTVLVAEGVYRGLYVGFLWGTWLTSSEVNHQAKKNGVALASRLSLLLTSYPVILSNAIKASFAFSSFFGLFSLLKCNIEGGRRNESAKTTFLAGTISGVGLGLLFARIYGERMNWRNIVVTGLITGGICAGGQYWKNSHSGL
eukprot:TRINITY_DN6531_c0_g1_i1.p1 TRINITY_DN6531_c0_g1~~TRINITY_DN6531_c0_g1_i1.p1  ORF type:complete len:156 (-),score=14.55 TRINITY_DN6531_c0_g1_i1:11-478(-)